MRALLSKLVKKRKPSPNKTSSDLLTHEKRATKRQDTQSCAISMTSQEEQECQVVDILIKMKEHLKITKINSSLQGEYRTLCLVNHMLCENPIKVQNIQKFLLTKTSEKTISQNQQIFQKSSPMTRNAIQYYTLYSNGLIFQFYSVRALLWKVSLQHLPASKNKWVSTMEGTLITYHEHIVEHIIDFVAKKKVKKELPIDQGQQNCEKKRKASDHPLNSTKESKWKTFFEDKELWNKIEKDTLRTKPNCKFFREEFQIQMQELKEMGVQRNEVHLSLFREKTYYYDCLTRIIYIFLKTNYGFSYCQGMNELAALIFYSFANKNSEYFRRVAQSDAFHCFQKIMRTLHKLNIPGFLNGEKYSHRFEELLKKVDMRLYEELEAKKDSLNNLRILSIKWFNSLFLNEYQLDETLILWDGFIATICVDQTRQSTITFQNLLMCVALALVHINRNALSQGQNPMSMLSKIHVSPQTLLEKALNLYKIFRQFFQ